MSGQGSGGNVIAALCNVFIAGLGQLIQGRILPALGFFIAVSVSYALYFLVVPLLIGAIFHLWSIIDAAKFKADS